MAIPPLTRFPIVGIGASAGGLEALEQFIRNVPVASGMAFVIVQHLDPTHVGMLAEILQRATPMVVAQITDLMRVDPDRVYVIPPNADLSIQHNVLHLTAPSAPRGLRLPVDHFFRSLAADAATQSIGVILSGMGSDGTLGLAAIKRQGGTTFVQSPSSAGFDGMPTSAIDADVADFVAPVDALPAAIRRSVLHMEGPVSDDASVNESHAFDQVLLLLRTRTGHDFALYKKNTVRRRIERRVSVHRLANVAAYVKLLQQNPQELELLFKELLISVTSFFRDAPVWEQLKQQVLPALLKQRTPGQPVRGWIAGCATGEEAYSLAMLFREAVDREIIERETAPKAPAEGSIHAPHIEEPTLLLFATDLDSDAINRARVGLFPFSIAADVSRERLQRFFVKTERGYQVTKAIRESIVFAPHNVAMDPPFTRLDILSCRNLLIYLTPELQNKLLPLFHYCLNPQGILLLGNSESIGTATDMFAPIPGNTHLFARLDAARPRPPIDFPTSLARGRARHTEPTVTQRKDTLQAAAERVLLEAYSPAAVLADEKGDILFINGRTGQYLEPAAGKTNWNVFAMARDALRYELSDAVRQAIRERKVVSRPQVKLRQGNATLLIDVTVQPLAEPDVLRGLLLILFAPSSSAAVDASQPVTPAAWTDGDDRSGSHLVELELELTQARDVLQHTREEARSVQEELNSANEELQSTNEELQSTNEELTTSKEEMQSMNEELQSLNHELQIKVDDLSRVTNDMKNLLESTEIATVFLDADLRVRLFTAGSNRIFKLIPGDTGRPITDLSSELEYPALADHAREVLRTLAVHEQQAAARDGRWFLVRIMPYRTLENMVEGVAITFADITASKRLEAQLRATQVGLEEHIAAQAQQIDAQGEKQDAAAASLSPPGSVSAEAI